MIATSHEPIIHLFVGGKSVLLVNEEGFEGVGAEFRVELLAALKKVLNKCLDFSSSVNVKRELVGGEEVRLKTLGIPWSYCFVSTGASGTRLLDFGEEENNFKEFRVLPCTLVLRCLLKK
jgi:hypothetical protein